MADIPAGSQWPCAQLSLLCWHLQWPTDSLQHHRANHCRDEWAFLSSSRGEIKSNCLRYKPWLQARCTVCKCRQCTDVLNKRHSLLFLCFQGSAAVHCVFWDFQENSKCYLQTCHASSVTSLTEPLTPWHCSLKLWGCPVESVLLVSIAVGTSAISVNTRGCVSGIVQCCIYMNKKTYPQKKAEMQWNIRLVLTVTSGKSVGALLWSSLQYGSDS